MKNIVVCNQKGGVGKTTTAVNLSAGLGILGKRVLLVDFDPQGNATSGVGLDKGTLTPTVYEVILDGLAPREAIRTTAYKLDILPANINLAGAEIELAQAEGREFRQDLEKLKALSSILHILSLLLNRLMLLKMEI